MIGSMKDAGRVIVPELLDDSDPAAAVDSLRDLVKINRYLGGYSTLRWLIAQVTAPGEAVSVLDVGAASGDMGARIVSFRPRAEVTFFDYRASHLRAASGPKVVGDAFQMPFAARSFDFVFSSLFLHHFDDAAVAGLLASFSRIARRAVLAIDLERGPLGTRFIPATRWLFRWDPITMHDAPVSVRAAFKKDELHGLAERAGLQGARVRMHRPWSRLSLIAPATMGSV